MTRICFIDLETTSLRPDRRAWEIGVIVRDEDEDDAEYCWFVDIDDLDLGNADPASLRIGRFYDRHPEMLKPVQLGDDWAGEETALRWVEDLTRGAVIVGVNPGFDTETLAVRMRERGICPSWNYRLVDARTLAAGALRMPPPWDVDAILSAFGVSCPEELRHTAMGDAKLARDLFDAVLAEPPLATAVERWMELNPAPAGGEVAARAEAREVLADVAVAFVEGEPAASGVTSSAASSVPRGLLRGDVSD